MPHQLVQRGRPSIINCLYAIQISSQSTCIKLFGKRWQWIIFKSKSKSIDHKPLYNTFHYHMVLDTTQFENGSKQIH